MGNVQAQRLHHTGTALLQLAGLFRIGIRGKELALLPELPDLADALTHLGLGHVITTRIFCKDFFDNFVGSVVFIEPDDVIGHLVHHMNGAGIRIEDDVQSSQLISVYHDSLP